MIFISYRRSDGKAAALLLYEDLLKHGFSSTDVFLDLNNILAEDYTKCCRREISSCDIFLLLVTNDSFKKKEPHDDYYNEIHQALDENKTIIPISYDSVFNEEVVPNEFTEKNLHLLNAIRYDLEYKENSIDKIVRAITKYRRATILSTLASLFAIPLVLLTIYIGISCIGGVIRYIWDNYWLSENTCQEIASQLILRDDENVNVYYYVTRDSLYVFDRINKDIRVLNNQSMFGNSGIQINIEPNDIRDAGFWTMAVALVYEIAKVRYKPHGNGKQVGVIIAGTVCVIAGFGLGFVVERMMFPVRDCKSIQKRLHSKEWWDIIVSKRETLPTIQKTF